MAYKQYSFEIFAIQKTANIKTVQVLENQWWKTET